MRKLTLLVGAVSLCLGLVGCEPGDADGDGEKDGPSGTCAAIFACYEVCGMDEAACEACYADASAQAQADFDALFACADASGCADDACLQQACADEAAACH